ncbi:MAG: ABC transporter ATP-binding protein, partial [Acidimicrobiia bacterium]|nr:ABC transporter ATP-binding protein [Acidimicrobiia bacterium]
MGEDGVLERLGARQEWTFFGVMARADRPLATAWWAILVLRGVLPAGFAIAMGALVGAVDGGRSLAVPLAVVGVVFVLMQMLAPIHLAVGYNLGDRTSAWVYDLLTEACVAPPGMGHLEDPELSKDLQAARELDLGMTGPPLSISMDFIAGSMVEMVAGVASAAVLFAYAWWAPILLAGAWLSTHW